MADDTLTPGPALLTLAPRNSRALLARFQVLIGLVGHEGTDECIRPSGNVPVMRCKTLKASADGLDGLLAYYADMAENRTGRGVSRHDLVDYYLDPDEPAGRWWGSGIGALGLAGKVDGAHLRALLDVRRPGDGSKLGRKFGDSSARGFDATFSPS